MTALVEYRLLSNGIAMVRLNRPEKHNALNMDMFLQISDTAQRLKKDRSVRAVIVTGAGPDFCTGLDVKSVLTKPSSAFRLLFKLLPGRANLAQRVSQLWRQLPVPVIMAIQGRCWGGGLQIALGGDFRLATPDSVFSIMESRYGLIPDMGGNLMLRQVMRADQAMLLAMTGREISAQEALDNGLITTINENPEQAAMSLALELAERSPDAIAAVKKLYLNNWHNNDSTMLGKETWYQIRILKGRNQKIAQANSRGQSAPYADRLKW